VRKKAGKKVAAKKRKGACQIRLLAAGGAFPARFAVSSAAKPRICWRNEADRGLTISFPDFWPFVEPPEPIQVKAGKNSKKYTMHSGTGAGPYDYLIQPDLTSAGSPGDPPGLDVGP
jgi:hypothetical protein